MLRSAMLGFGFLVISTSAHAQETATLPITVRIPASIASFQNQRLVVVLMREDITGEGRDVSVDRYVNQKISHTTGRETVVKFTIGENAKLVPGIVHKLVVSVFDPASKVTHVGERPGQLGPILLQSGTWPASLNVILRAEK